MDLQKHYHYVALKLSEIINNVDIPDDSKLHLKDLVEHNELGIALEWLCGSILENNLDKKTYSDEIRDLATRMALLDSQDIQAYLK